MKANRDQNGPHLPTSSTGPRDKALVKARAKPPKADDKSTIVRRYLIFCRSRNEWHMLPFVLLLLCQMCWNTIGLSPRILVLSV